MWCLDALCRGSNGDFCRETKTQEKYHFGVRDLFTGRCNSKDLINSDKTGLDLILEFESIWDHRSITFDGTYLILFLREKVNKEVGYYCKRGRDRINLLSMTPVGVYNPFWIIDFLRRCSSWFWDKVCNVLRKLFISNWLFDNSQAWRVNNGRLGCWNFPFACVSSFRKSRRQIRADTNNC